MCGFYYIPHFMNIKGLWDGAAGISSLSSKNYVPIAQDEITKRLWQFWWPSLSKRLLLRGFESTTSVFDKDGCQIWKRSKSFFFLWGYVEKILCRFFFLLLLSVKERKTLCKRAETWPITRLFYLHFIGQLIFTPFIVVYISRGMQRTEYVRTLKGVDPWEG